MSRPCGLVVLALLVTIVTGEPASAQSRLRQRGALRNRGESKEPSSQPTPESPPSVEELLRRLDELEGRTGQPARKRDGGLVLMLEDARLANTNRYDASGIRYFVARLLAINLTDQQVTIPTNRIVLIADTQEQTMAESASLLSRTRMQIGDRDQRNPQLPESLEVPPHGTTSLRVVFAGLESASAVPALLLRAEWDGGTAELDVNDYERGVLALRTERLGPQDCLAMLTIHGELNSINAGTLTDELDALTLAGVMRVVVDWGPSASPTEDHVFNWLATGTSPDSGIQFTDLPHIPVTIQEFHVVRQADRGDDHYFAYGIANPVSSTAEEAVSAALRTAFEAVPRMLLRNELAHGHRLSRLAALKHAGARLGPRELPLVLAASDDPDPDIRLRGLAALGQYGDQEAIDRLVAGAKSTDADVSQAAVNGLAGSRYPQAQRALSQHLDALENPQIISVISILANHPRAEWTDRIAGYYESSDPELRLAALRALVQLGHPRIVDFLEAAISSSDSELRSEAFVQLSQRTDPRSEEIAIRYALQRLESDAPDAATYGLLVRTREQRAIAPLFKRLDALTGNREQIVELILQLGGGDVVPQMLERYDGFSAAEKAIVLNQMVETDSVRLHSLALETLRSQDARLIDVGVRILTAHPDRDTVAVLVEALGAAESIEAWSILCNGLATIGDAGARAALMSIRNQEDRAKRDQVINALTRIKQTSPAYHFSFLAGQQIEQEQHEKALKLLDLAIEFDPEFAEAYAKRGHISLLQQTDPCAQADFGRARELDPYDSLAVSGRAIVSVMQGDIADGVAQIKDAAETFPGDATFEYNSACVYGRAIEAMQSAGDEESVNLRNEYQTEALRHLRESVKLGFNMPDFIKADPDLAVLHDVPEFEELLAQLPSTDREDEELVLPGDDEIEFDIRSLR